MIYLTKKSKQHEESKAQNETFAQDKETLQDIEEIAEKDACSQQTREEPAQQAANTDAAEEKYAELEGKYAELEEKFLRLAAEYDNFKRRTQREKEMLYQDAVADTVSQLLPVLDNIDRALQSANETADVKTVTEGVQMVAKLAADTFEKMGIESICAVGSAFDAELHNAVMHVEDCEYGECTVAEEFLKGYKYKDRVIRHSMVKVAN